MSEPVTAVNSVDKSSSIADIMNDANVASKYSYAMIVLYVLNKVGLEQQQQVMQTRSQLMDVMTRMQNDFTTISEYLSQIQNNSYSSQAVWAYGGGKGFGEWLVQGLNSFNGLNSSFYDIQGNYNTISGGLGLTSFQENVSAQFQTSTQGFLNAVKDLFYSSSSGTGVTVADISKITPPQGGQAFDLSSMWAQLGGKGGPFSSFDFGNNTVISTNPSDHASLMQQYMYYQAKMQVYSSSSGKIKEAEDVEAEKPGQGIAQFINFNPSSSNADPLEQTFIQLLTALNTNVAVNRQGNAGQDSIIDKNLGSNPDGTPKTFLELIAYGQVNGTLLSNPQMVPDLFPVAVNQVQPGIYLAVSMMGFDYFWTKNPNASTSSPFNHYVASGSGEIVDSNKDLAGAPAMDPLSNVYMTNNSVQTNVGQQTSQGNNNFQQDVNVAGQLSNIGQNVEKSFFDGVSTMNRNFRIS